MGREIVGILGKRHSDYTDDDLAMMKRVPGYGYCHLAHRPNGEVAPSPCATAWRSGHKRAPGAGVVLRFSSEDDLT